MDSVSRHFRPDSFPIRQQRPEVYICAAPGLVYMLNERRIQFPDKRVFFVIRLRRCRRDDYFFHAVRLQVSDQSNIRV